MKVAIPVIRLESTGGIQRYTWHVAHELARRGHEVTIHAPRAFEVNCPPGVAFQAVGSGRQPIDRRGGIDMMSFPFLASASILRTQPRARRYAPVGSMLLPGVYTAHSVHAAWVKDRQVNLAGPGPSIFDRGLMAFERAAVHLPRTRLTIVSPMAADLMASEYGIDVGRLTIAAPAIDVDEFHPPTHAERARARARYNLGSYDYAVGIVANYNFENKGVGRLIAACAKVGAVLLVAGVDGVRAEGMAAAAREAGGRVEFLGLVQDVLTFFHALDVLAFPSDSEGYPSSAHEGMAAGVATLLSRHCGITSLFSAGPEAAVVDRRDAEGLAAALDELRDSERRARLAAEGCRWARKRTWAELGAVIEGELEQVRPDE